MEGRPTSGGAQVDERVGAPKDHEIAEVILEMGSWCGGARPQVDIADRTSELLHSANDPSIVLTQSCQ
ncbi:hypothetical protein N0V93_007406 [Gnomoniopsis smithogilvyi]|uniref:Uncharacterized protein n=1 Tax=Gnomoniopsis smithogilvyi TaxID=1191159 RepID=A0A9W8YQ02_9PEZI|nr:hypothetical protein N0V93_007406 [Gnomoniopsis smithogilvyi]